MKNFRKGLFPNLTSRMDEITRNKWERRYLNLKRGTIVLTLGTVSLSSAREFFSDVLVSKLYSYGYGAMIAIAAGPVIQLVSIPFYVYFRTSRVKRFAVGMADIGAKVTSGEMGVMNWMWCGADLLLFGESIPVARSRDLIIFRNETSPVVAFLEYL